MALTTIDIHIADGNFSVTGFTTGDTNFDTYVTGGTYDNGIVTFTNNTGGTFSVTGFSSNIINTGTPNVDISDTYITGGTYSAGTLTFTNNIGGTFTVSGDITASSIYLGNVDNTSDISKPVSYLQQNAIDTSLTTSKNYTDTQIAGVVASSVPLYLQERVSGYSATTLVEYNALKNTTASIYRRMGSQYGYKHYIGSGGNIGIGNSAFTKNLIVASWFTGRTDTTTPSSNGFPSGGGILTEIRVYPVAETVAGAKMQAFIVRPTSQIVSGTASFSVVQAVGELDASQPNRWHIWEGLSIPVLGGDMLAIRGIGVNLQLTQGESGSTGFNYVRANATDLSLNVTGFSGTVEKNRSFMFEADITTSPDLVRNTAMARVVSDVNGYIPSKIGRLGDLPWRNKKIVWVGTSIPAKNGVNSYPNQIGTFCNAQMINNSIGSSHATWDGINQLSLSATKAELNVLNPSAGNAYSYESKLLGYNADLYVFDHGFNDRLAPLGVISAVTMTGTITTTTTSTTVTGNGTFFTTQLKVGELILKSDGETRIGKIASIESNTALTLTTSATTNLTNVTYTWFDRKTFYGAMNFLISELFNDKPSAKIAFVVPHSKYTNNGADVNTVPPIIDAIFALANKYYSNNVLDFYHELGLNSVARTILATDDTLHPSQATINLMANKGYKWILGL